MFKSIAPDYLFHNFYEITPEFLKSIGISVLLSDIDNTLAPYEMPMPDERIKEWASSLEENGIKLALISNNDRERVELFNSELKLKAIADAHKPGVKILKRLCSELGADSRNCAVLGDQLLTDALAGRRLGVRVIIVPPIKDKKSLFFRFKRWLERPVMKRYIKKCGYTSSALKEKDTDERDV